MKSLAIYDNIPRYIGLGSPPSFSSPPVIVGTASVGQSISYTTGGYSGTPFIVVSVQWKANGVNATGNGSTTSTYTPISADLNKTLTVLQTLTNNTGSINLTSSGVVVSANQNTASSLTAPSFANLISVGSSSNIIPGTWSTAVDSTRTNRIYVQEGTGGLITPYKVLGPATTNVYVPEANGNSSLIANTGLSSLIGCHVYVDELAYVGGVVQNASSKSPFALVQAPATAMALSVLTPTVTVPQNQTITPFNPMSVTGGILPYVWSENAGIIAGISYSSSNGQFIGNPPSTFNDTIIVTVHDAASNVVTGTFNFICSTASSANIYQAIPISLVASSPAANPTITTSVSGRTLVLMCSTASAVTDVTPLDSTGNIWQKVFFSRDTAGAGSDVVGLMCYVCFNSSVGVHNLTWAGNVGGYCEGNLLEINPCTGVQVLGTETLAQDTASTLATSSISTTGSTLVFAMLGISAHNGNGSAAITNPPTGWSSLYVQNATSTKVGAQHSYKEYTADSTNQSTSWSFLPDTAGSHYASIIFAFTESGSSGGGGANVAPTWVDGIGPGFLPDYATSGALVLDFGDALNSPTGYDVQIYNDATAISGASASNVTNYTYTYVSGDSGHVLSATVVARNSAGSSEIFYIPGVPIP